MTIKYWVLENNFLLERYLDASTLFSADSYFCLWSWLSHCTDFIIYFKCKAFPLKCHEYPELYSVNHLYTIPYIVIYKFIFILFFFKKAWQFKTFSVPLGQDINIRMYNINFFCLLVVLIVLSLIDKTVNAFINDIFYFNLRKTESHTEQHILILRWPVEEIFHS